MQETQGAEVLDEVMHQETLFRICQNEPATYLYAALEGNLEP